MGSTICGWGLIGILIRMGVVRFLTSFAVPSGFLKPIELTGVAVSLALSAPLMLVPNPFMPTCSTSPASFALTRRRRPLWTTSTSLRRREVTESSHSTPRGIVKSPPGIPATGAPPKLAPSRAQLVSLPTRIPMFPVLTAAGASPATCDCTSTSPVLSTEPVRSFVRVMASCVAWSRLSKPPEPGSLTSDTKRIRIDALKLLFVLLLELELVALCSTLEVASSMLLREPTS